MLFDNFEKKEVESAENNSLTNKLKSLKDGLKLGFSPEIKAPELTNELSVQLAEWAGFEQGLYMPEMTQNIVDAMKEMYSGIDVNTELKNYHTLGLKAISEWKIHPDYKDMNIKQQSGYAAEVVSTAKDNIKAMVEKTGIKTFRADDRPDLFVENDQYVDKIRVNSAGDIVERIQVKFFGESGEECFRKLISKQFEEKYIESGKIDKIEIPKDYYDAIKDGKLIEQKLADYTKQLESVTKQGKMDVAEDLTRKIENLKKLDKMLERSSVSSKEAIEARVDPKMYMEKLVQKEVINESIDAGVKTGLTAAAITMAVSTVDNVQKIATGEATVEEALKDVAKDTGIAGGVGFGSGFVTHAVAAGMKASSHELISSLGNTALPAAVVSFGVQSYDSISDFAKGEIDGKQLAYDLGENAAKVAAGTGVVTLVGAAVSGVNPILGAGITIASSMVGTAVASEAYKTAVEVGSEKASILAAKAQETASNTIEYAKQYIPESVSSIKDAINSFAKQNNVPINV